jgi:hypothetical protein
MSKWTRLFLAAMAAVLAAGCPFEAHVPLGEPRAGSLDPRLYGLWTWIDPEGGAVIQLRVRPFNDAEYLVDYEKFGPKAKDEDRQTYRVFGVVVGDQTFLDVNPLKDPGEQEPPSHLFARYALSDCGALTLRFVGDHAVPKELASDAKGLHDFLAAHPKDATLDDTDGPMVFRRAGA